MLPEEHRISSDGREARRESSEKMKPDKMPQRGQGIAVLEKLRTDDPPKCFSAGMEVLVHPIHPQLLDSSPLVSRNGRAPMSGSLFRRDDSSCPRSPLSVSAPGTKRPPRGPRMPLPLMFRQRENQQKISQATNSFYPVSGAHFQTESEPPSIQSCRDFLNASSWTDQQRTTHQRVGVKRPWPFQTYESNNHIVTYPNCDAMMINGPQEKISDWLSVEGNLNRHHPTVERNFLSKLAKEDVGHKTSVDSSETRISYNFMELRHTDYAADPHVIAIQIQRGLEGLDAVDVELKL